MLCRYIFLKINIIWAAGIEEVKSRLVVAPPKYVVKVIDKNGTRKLAEI
jgi:hypothetical protein